MVERVRAVILGAGFGGITVGHHLRQAGIEDFVILEEADAVGGTWRDNTYPGCACDVPVALYQLSFAPSLHWSHLFPRWNELRAYIEQVVDMCGLRGHLRLGDGGRSAVWDGTRASWTVRTAAGRVYEADIFVPALGQLNRPQLPDIAGRESFAGPAFHSARWDHSVDLGGRRVGVIGSAASAVQLIPEVARVAGHLTVFQRSPNWLLPRNDRAITDLEKQIMLTALDVAMMGRELIYWNAEKVFWQAFQYTELGRSYLTEQSRMHLEAQIADPELRARLTPDYPIGTRRVLFCDDYYPALQQPNVTLETASIAHIDPGGVTMADGTRHDLDVLVFATGFETTGWKWSCDVVGEGGRTLAQAWASDGPEAYLGITAAGFPNLFMTYGPNTNLGHNSITFMIERQAEYIARCVTGMAERGVAAMTPSVAAQARFNAALQQRLAGTAWADPAAGSWYKTASGRITQNWGDTCEAYRAAVAEVAWEGFEMVAAQVSANAM
jgi:cation diffusion facilitator CzcD-associated flavoprotein CzcO